jgi:hypothetical protein
MGRRLVVTVVLDEGGGHDVFDQLADVVCATRGVVGWRGDRFAGGGEEQESFGPPPGQVMEATPELEAVAG